MWPPRGRPAVEQLGLSATACSTTNQFHIFYTIDPWQQFFSERLYASENTSQLQVPPRKLSASGMSPVPGPLLGSCWCTLLISVTFFHSIEALTTVFFCKIVCLMEHLTQLQVPSGMSAVPGPLNGSCWCTLRNLHACRCCCCVVFLQPIFCT